MRKCAALLALLLATAAYGAETWYLPGAAEADGANSSRFSSTIFVTNPGDTEVVAAFRFIAYPGGRAPKNPVNRTLAPRETLKISKALDSLFGYNTDAGTITVTAEKPLLMYMTTSNVANPAGTFGLAIPAIVSGDLLSGGANTGHAIWASHNGENFTLGFRTNVGGVLVDPNSEIEIRVYDENSIPRGSRTVSSSVPASFQLSLSDIIGPTNLAVGRIEFDVRQGQAAVYASVNDNRTSDGVAQMFRRLAFGATEFVIDGVARSSGVNNTRWTTDLRLFNPGFFPAVLTISSMALPRAANYPMEVPARTTVEILDVLGPSFLNFSEGVAGAVRIKSTAALMGAARTANSDPTGAVPGTFSGFQEPVRYTAGFLKPGSRSTLTGLEQSAAFRTNIGFLAGPDPAVVNLTLRDRFGNVVATNRLELKGSEWSQLALTALFKNVSIPQLSRVDIAVESGLIDVYASKIDNGTGDPVVITPLPLP